MLIAVIVLSAFLLYDGYIEIEESHLLSNQIIEEQQKKDALLFEMHKAARQRLFILYQMASETDIFEIDDLNQSLDTQALIFMNSRREYLSMELTQQDRILLDRHCVTLPYLEQIPVEFSG